MHSIEYKINNFERADKYARLAHDSIKVTSLPDFLFLGAKQFIKKTTH